MNESTPTRRRSDAAPTRHKSDLADLLELLLDKGIVVNADIVVTVGDTELLGVHLRAAIASFETAAKYGLEFPEGTDMERVERAAGVEPLDDPGEQTKLNDLGGGNETDESGPEDAEREGANGAPEDEETEASTDSEEGNRDED